MTFGSASGQMITKDAFSSGEVNFDLSEKDIAEIASETFPMRQLSPQKLELLRKYVNLALSLYWAPVPDARDRIELPVCDLVNLLKAVDKKLAPPLNRWFLAAAGRKYASQPKAKDNYAFDKLMMSCGYSDYADFVEATISEFRRLLLQILKWGNDRNLLEQVSKDISPTLKSRTQLICDFLPMIFEVVFEQRCANSNVGPGTRFIVGVLRKSGLHKGKIATVQALVVRSRQRAKTRKESHDRK